MFPFILLKFHPVIFEVGTKVAVSASCRTDITDAQSSLLLSHVSSSRSRSSMAAEWSRLSKVLWSLVFLTEKCKANSSVLQTNKILNI